MTKTLVIGLGNPILGDDGVGWRVTEEVARKTKKCKDIEVDCLSVGGLSLMEHLTGFQQVILVDAIYTGQKPIGSVSQFKLSELPDVNAGHSSSAHDTSLRNALNVGRSMNIELPEDDDVIVVAIEAENVYDFTEQLSLPVAQAVPRAVQVIMTLLKGEDTRRER